MRRATLAGALLAALAHSSCDGAGPSSSRALHELERMAFVPTGRVRLQGYRGSFAEWTIREPLLFDLFETTREDQEHYLGVTRHEEVFTVAEARWGPDRSTWPAYLSFHEAQELAALRSMRLPTGREWIYVAIGSATLDYPWGDVPQQSIANTLELGLGEPTPVGTFENGRSPFGCYDMLGNVWEWVSDAVPSSGPKIAASTPGGVVSALGGSYLDRRRPIYESPRLGDDIEPQFFGQTLDAQTIRPSIGVRLCADAREYLWRTAPTWGDGAEARRLLTAVGRRWARVSREAPALLDELAARPGAPPGLGWLRDGARTP